MAKITRQQAREALFCLLFETEFRNGEDPVSIYELACDNREIPNDKYIREAYFGIISKADVLDRIIGNYSKGWKADRLSKVSRSVLRIAAYEMVFMDSIPMNVSISQAVELTLKYGEDKSKSFVNGVLSGLFKDIDSKGKDAVLDEIMALKTELPEEPASSDSKDADEVE